MYAIKHRLVNSIDMLNLCPHKIPSYMKINDETFIDELNMVTMYTFASLNFVNYPPPNTTLKAACDTVLDGLHGKYFTA